MATYVSLRLRPSTTCDVISTFDDLLILYLASPSNLVILTIDSVSINMEVTVIVNNYILWWTTNRKYAISDDREQCDSSKFVKYPLRDWRAECFSVVLSRD